MLPCNSSRVVKMQSIIHWMESWIDEIKLQVPTGNVGKIRMACKKKRVVVRRVLGT